MKQLMTVLSPGTRVAGREDDPRRVYPRVLAALTAAPARVQATFAPDDMVVSVVIASTNEGDATPRAGIFLAFVKTRQPFTRVLGFPLRLGIPAG